jgi:hypothetical protein
VRLTGVSEAISQQIAKYDSSEFDDDKVSIWEGVFVPGAGPMQWCSVV